MVLALRSLWPKERTEKKDSKEVILVNSMIIYKDSCFCSSRSLIKRDMVFVGLPFLNIHVENKVYWFCFTERK